MEKKHVEKNFELMTNEDLAHAIELMVPPEELKSRQVMIAILKAADLTAQEVREQIITGEKLFEGPAVSWSF